MASMEELMLIFRAQDEVSGVTSQIDSEIQSMASSAQAALTSMTSGMASISTVSDNLIGSLNSGRSAADLIFGTSTRAETNKVLLNNMTSTQEAAEELFSTVDRVTDTSLTSMQDLIPALNAFRAATGASDQEILNITDDMANFGAAVLAQTGSTDLALTAMMSLSKGIKGAFASLDQYGISEDALMRTGLWNGEEDDVEGFMEAVTKVTGSTEELMETNQGLDALIQKAFSRGGKKIGNEFLPIIKDVKHAFLDLDNELGGNLTAGILVLGESIDVVNSALFNISTAANGIRELRNGFKFASEWIKNITGIGQAAKDTSNAISSMGNAMSSLSAAGNVTEIGANVSGMGAAGAGVVNNTGRTGRAVDAGSDALLAADMLRGGKDSKKTREEALEELTSRASYARRMQDELDTAMEAEGQVFDLLGRQRKLEGDLGSGVFGRGMVDQLRKDIQVTEDEIDTIIGRDMWSGVRKSVQKETSKPLDLLEEFKKTSRGEVGSHSKGFLLDRLFGRKDNPLLNGDLNKEARLMARETRESLEGASEFLFDDDLIEEWSRSEWGLGDAIKNRFGGFKESITNAFSSIKNFDLKGTLLTPFRKIADFDFGGSLQNLLEKGFSGLGNIASSIRGKFGSFADTIKNIKLPDIKGKLHGLSQSIYQSISSFSFTDSFSGLKDRIKGLRSVTEVADEVDDVVDGIDAVGDAAGAVGAAAPAMEAGAAGAEATAVATTTLSGAFTSMIVPALALAAVIIIMIPIVAVIAAEAMLFIKLLGEFMESLNFDGIDLSGSIEGLKQIATGLAYVAAAMLAMTAVSILVGINSLITMFTGITGPLKVAVKAINEAANQLKQFESIQIDPSVGTNLKTISDSLVSISSAMLALTSVTITTGFSGFIAWAMQFGSITSALEQAKNEIIQASSKLNEFSGLTPLDSNVAQNIQNVCDSLKSVGDAIGALRSMRDSQNWDTIIGDFLGGIFGGVDIGAALDAVKQDVYDAANALQTWTLPDIPQDIGDKVGKVSSALEAISNAFQSLRTMRDNGNWDDWMGGIFGGTDIQGALDAVIKDLQTAANAIKNINVDGVDDTKVEGLGRIGSAIQKVSEVATTLNNMPPLATTFDPNTITTAITTIQKAASELGKLSTTTFGEGGDPTSILGTINTAISGVRDTLTNLAGGFSAPATNIGSQIVTGVQSGLSPLGSTIQGAISSAISSASGTATSGGQTLGRHVTDGFKSTLKLADVMTTEMGHVKTAVDNGISAAVSAARSGATQVVQAFKNGINVGSPGDIANTMRDEMGYTNQFLRGAFGPLGDLAYGLGRRIVNSFGNPSLDVITSMNPLTPGQLQEMSLISSPAPSNSTGNVTNIIIQEGAIPIDARNMTQHEARQMLLLALESLDLYDPNPNNTGVA